MHQRDTYDGHKEQYATRVTFPSYNISTGHLYGNFHCKETICTSCILSIQARKKETLIKMSYIKLFTLVLILHCAKGGSAKKASISTKDEGDSISNIQEILSKYDQEIHEIEQTLAEQKLEHEMSKASYEKEISELRRVITNQNGKIKEQDGHIKTMIHFMTQNEAQNLKKDNAIRAPGKTSDIKPVNASVEELEQRVDDLEIAMLDVREDVIDIGADVVRVSADVLVAEGNIDALEAEDAELDQRISVLEATVNDYLDVAIGFHVTLNAADQTLALGDAILFDTILTNYGEAFNLTSGSFLAPRHGLYGFSLYFLTTHEGLTTHVCVAVNGVCACNAHADFNHDKYETGTCSALHELQPGDVVNVVLHADPQSDGGAVDNYGSTGFNGWLYKAL